MDKLFKITNKTIDSKMLKVSLYQRLLISREAEKVYLVKKVMEKNIIGK